MERRAVTTSTPHSKGVVAIGTHPEALSSTNSHNRNKSETKLERRTSCTPRTDMMLEYLLRLEEIVVLYFREMEEGAVPVRPTIDRHSDGRVEEDDNRDLEMHSLVKLALV